MTMKTIYIGIIGPLLGVGSLFAQEVAPCSGNTQRSNDAFLKSAYFNAVGINLQKYDWSEPTINCHINMFLESRKKSDWMKYGAFSAVGIGAGLLISGISAGNRIVGTNLRTGEPEYGSGGGLIATGAVLIGGSIPLFIFSKKHKEKSNRHLNQVSDYYRRKGL